MIGPTQRQLTVLRFIAWQRALNGTPPTVREVADYRGTAYQDAHQAIRELRAKGLLEPNSGDRARALVPTPLGREVLRADALGYTV